MFRVRLATQDCIKEAEQFCASEKAWQQKLFDRAPAAAGGAQAQTSSGHVLLQTISFVKLVWPKNGTFTDPINSSSPRQATVVAEEVLGYDFNEPLNASVAKMREAGQQEGDFDSLVEQYLLFVRQRYAEVKRSIAKFIEVSLETNDGLLNLPAGQNFSCACFGDDGRLDPESRSVLDKVDLADATQSLDIARGFLRVYNAMFPNNENYVTLLAIAEIQNAALPALKALGSLQDAHDACASQEGDNKCKTTTEETSMIECFTKACKEMASAEGARNDGLDVIIKKGGELVKSTQVLIEERLAQAETQMIADASALSTYTDPIDLKDLENKWGERHQDFSTYAHRKELADLVKKMNGINGGGMKRFTSLCDALALRSSAAQTKSRKENEAIAQKARVAGRTAISYRVAAKICVNRSASQVSNWKAEAKSLGIKVHKNVTAMLDSL